MARYTATVTATGQIFEGISEATLAVLRRTFDAVTVADEAHSVSVAIIPGRYRYRPVCSCGEQFRGYVAAHAAQLVADAHAS